jgi:ABC-type Co2+ transport system permease subunit
MATYLPLMLGEAIITGVAVAFLKRAKPDALAVEKGS